MDVYLIKLFVYIIFYNIIFANGIKIQTAIYKVPRNHPDIRKCAMEILHINNVADARISDQTGKCEKLTDEYTTVEPGYEYIEKLYFKIEFQPAISTDLRNQSDGLLNLLNLPLTMWSRLDFSFVRKPPTEYFVWLSFENFGDGFPFVFSVKERYLELNIVPPGKNVLYFPFEWQAMCPLVECKFSLVIKDKQIKVLANDKEVQNAIFEVERTLLRQRRTVIISAHAKSVARFSCFQFKK